MGAVYLATDTLSNQQAAVRVINSYLVRHTSLQNRLIETCTELSNLKHPSLARFYTFIEQGGELYLLREYIEGISLNEYIHSAVHSLDVEKVWSIMMQLMAVFEYAHTRGFAHHNINPNHIIITNDWKVKVLDFGIAPLFANAESGILKPGIRLGKVQYLSPEQVHGKPLDVRSDIYSLGVILFELLTRQNPYPAVLSDFDIQHKIINDSLPPIKLYAQEIAHSYTMQTIVDKATGKNPAYRFQSFEEFRESLQEEKDERESLLLSEMMRGVSDKTQYVSPMHESSTIKLAQRQSQRKVLTQVFLVLTLVAAAMTFVFNYETSPSAETPVAMNNKSESKASKVRQIEKQNPVAVTKPESTTEKNKEAVTVGRRIKRIPKPEKSREPIFESNEIASASIGMSSEAEYNSIAEVDLQIKVKHFYEALRSKKISRVEGFYAPSITRFFNEYGISDEELKNLLLKAWQRTPEDNHEILWDTFRYYRDDKGNYVMDFYMNYYYRRANRDSWNTRKIYTMIKMDKNFKIYYMDGD
jgi:serine/threonine protein kinase